MSDKEVKRKLDALIVRNVGDLEASLRRALTQIDSALNGAAWDALKATLGERDWHFEDDREPDDRWFAPRQWLDKEGDADPWFRLMPLDRANVFETWLAHYVAPADDRQKFSLLWCWHRFYVTDYKAAAEAAAVEIEAIRSLGFRQDGRELFLPIEFDPEAIARAFETGDFKEALEPIGAAANVLSQAVEHFTSFRAQLLKKRR